jgi:hypothetical protein
MIRCRACGAGDVEVTDRIGTDAVVSCCRCGTVLWTWPEFLSRIETLIEAEAAGRAGSAGSRSSGARNRAELSIAALSRRRRRTAGSVR